MSSSVSFYGGAAGEVAISNKALRFLGAQEILSMGQKTREADLCLRVYPEARRELLALHHWSFATRYTTLAPLSLVPQDNATKALALACATAGFGQAYRLPSDCLAVQRLYPHASFALGEGGTLLTDAAPAKAAITVCVTDTTLYPPLFIEALARTMAASLAIALLNNARIEQMMNERFFVALEAARLADSVQAQPLPSDEAFEDTWLQARG